MMKPATILFLLLLLCSISGYGQDISQTPITWTINHGLDLRSNSNFSYQCTFHTSSSDSLVWSQNAGSFVSTFTVSSRNGTWTDVNSTGSMTYNVVLEGSTGTILFERTASGLFVTMDFPKNDPQGSWIKFQVSSISPEN